MKKELQKSSKYTIMVMLAFALLGIIFFFVDLGNEYWSFRVEGWQTIAWEALTLGIALGIKLYPGSYNYYDNEGKLIIKK